MLVVRPTYLLTYLMLTLKKQPYIVSVIVYIVLRLYVYTVEPNIYLFIY